MREILEAIDALVWGAPALILILGVGLVLSIRTRFAQLRLFPMALRRFFSMLRGGTTRDGVSPFQALCTALAATVGTGNLVGVAGAIALGGAGSIFWMWVCAVFGMVTKFAEASLAVRCRTTVNGEYVGGPMYMIRNGLDRKWHFLAPLYCFLGVFAAFGVGNATQIDAVLTGIEQAARFFGAQMTQSGRLAVGIVLSGIVGLMLLGGAKRIANAAELLVPFISCAYLALCIGVLIARLDAIPAAFSAIFRGAFSPRALTGGVVGSMFGALRVGVSRGVFTNEAGMGTASIAHAAAQVSHPCEQGLMGIMEVFLDTIIICTMTALVILCSGIPIPYGIDAGATLTAQAFGAVYGDWVTVFLALALGCFAFATVLGWGLYGARCAQFLFGKTSWKCYAIAQAGMVIFSAVMQTGTIWMLAGILNGLMAIPNLIALFALRGCVQDMTADFEKTYGKPADGGTYENLDQRKPLRTVPDAKIPSDGGRSKKRGKEDIPSEHRSARPSHPAGVL